MTQPAATPSRSPHDLSARYELVKRLGRGGMGEVFLAWKLLDGRQHKLVVLKRVLPHLADEAKATEQFMAEMAVAATLEHRCVVRVADWGQFQGSNCFEMELIDGMSVDDLLKVRAPDPDGEKLAPLPAVDVAWIGMQSCLGLAYAHNHVTDGQAGLIHRDISPDNLMLNTEGEVKIADWGIAKPITTSDGMATGTHHAVGKARYMSPEQWIGKPVDGRTDLYALGITLVVMLSGKQMFPTRDDEPIFNYIQRVIAGQRPSVLEIAPGAPPALVDVLERMLAVNRDDRPCSAEDLVDVFSAITRELGGDLHSVQKAFAACIRRYRPKGKPTEPTLEPPKFETGTAQSEKRLIETQREPAPSAAGPMPPAQPPTEHLPAPPTTTLPSPAGEPPASALRPLLLAGLAMSSLALFALLAGVAGFLVIGSTDDDQADAETQTPPVASQMTPPVAPNDAASPELTNVPPMAPAPPSISVATPAPSSSDAGNAIDEEYATPGPRENRDEERTSERTSSRRTRRRRQPATQREVRSFGERTSGRRRRAAGSGDFGL